jgi:hypothetical protein
MLRFLSQLFNGIKPKDKSPSNTSHTKESLLSLAKNNNDIIGFELSVGMVVHVPLKLLRRHGENAKKIPSADSDLLSGVWLPILRPPYDRLSKGGTMWSPAGHIPTDGAEVLQYLIAAREIIEAPLPQPLSDITEGLSRLEKIKALPGGPIYTRDREGQTVKSPASEDYFPLFFDNDGKALRLLLSEFGSPSYDGLTYDHLLELHSKGWTSIFEVLNAPDEVLLDLKSIGQKKLDKIRTNVSSVG